MNSCPNSKISLVQIKKYKSVFPKMTLWFGYSRVIICLATSISVEFLTIGDISDKFCGVHHAPLACVCLTFWFHYHEGSNLFPPRFEIHVSLSLQLATCLLKCLNHLGRYIVVFSLGFCFSNFRPYSSRVLQLIFISTFD